MDLSYIEDIMEIIEDLVPNREPDFVVPRTENTLKEVFWFLNKEKGVMLEVDCDHFKHSDNDIRSHLEEIVVITGSTLFEIMINDKDVLYYRCHERLKNYDGDVYTNVYQPEYNYINREFKKWKVNRILLGIKDESL